MIARGDAWGRACLLWGVEKTNIGDVSRTVIDGKEIEVFDTWGPGDWDVSELIDGADVIDGVRFVRLQEVLRWKELMNRPKDVEDIRVLRELLNN